MKYLKTFEQNIGDESIGDKLPDLKKYLISSETGDYLYSILENTNIVEWSGNPGQELYKILKVNHLYKYNPESGFIDKTKATTGKTSGLIYDMLDHYIKYRLIYQSDDLEDCINVIKMMHDIKKYNI